MPRPPTLATELQHSAVDDETFSMLPEPALSITIPSIQDDATLECRIYHPLSLSANPRAPPWRKHAAIVAHPYAPLGGCFDDAVVETVSEILLRQGFLVGTFNFRGAGKSTGRTSWTSKAEKCDYMSFAGFVYHYVHFLDPFKLRFHDDPKSPTGSGPLSPTSQYSTSEVTPTPGRGPILLMCGYSYGAMITKLLPSFDAVLECFATPKTASAAADIRLRAQHLAEKQNLILASARSALSESPTLISPRRAAMGGMRVGGDEDNRRSQDQGRRSFSLDAEDKIRKGVADLMQKTKNHHHHHHLRRKKQGENDMPEVKEEGEGQEREEEKDPEDLPRVRGLVPPTMAYLLISPPVGWATNLMTLNLGGPMSHFFTKRPRSTKPKKKSEAAASAEAESEDITTGVEQQEKQKMLDNPTLAIYGDSDMFVAVKRFREWTSKLQSIPGSKFRAHEISTAGHFYVEEGTMQRLADAVRAFSRELLAQAEHGGALTGARGCPGPVL